ncbi:hypothetical protein G4B88_015228 [Cannabis sativa]|uniref:TF-B3 domain-containing protein n=1 Tax=Cannabis sativa TaxID=3483 RepID=A0A7J6HBY0_CANSA|nr:hypothetical protein G4B88_015228 [Cannabis sativa]
MASSTMHRKVYKIPYYRELKENLHCFFKSFQYLQNIIRKQTYLTGQKKTEALTRAKGFKSDDPFFIVLMQPSFVGASYSIVVPFSFAKNHLLSVSKHEDVILKVQDERIWPVRKYTGRSQFRFEWGWKAFARDNDLKVGDVCVFVKRQNIGIMLFEVVTFYKNGVPNSPVLPAANNRTPCVKVEPSFTSNNYDNASMISHDIIPKKEVIEPSYKVCGESPELENFIRNQELGRKEKDEAFKRVKDFKSEDPFFIVPMQPSFVGSKSKYCMGMPSLFGKKYLVGTSTSPQDVILKVQDGRTWCVKYYVRPLGTSSKATIEGGWKAFVQDNELKVGDVCAFVLRNIIGIISFEVVIFHGNGVATSCMLPIPASTIPYDIIVKKEAIESTPQEKSAYIHFKSLQNTIAKDFKSKDPFFIVPMQPSSVGSKSKYNMWSSRCDSYVSGWKDLVCQVHCLCQTAGISSIFRIEGGWKAFVQDNDLKVGLSIASEAASKFFSNNPYFQLNLRSAHVRGHAQLYIPLAIANSWFEKKSQTVILWVGKEYWHVNLTINKGSSSSGLEHRFSAGWRAFTRDNSLNPTDICIFELIKKNQAEIKVMGFLKNRLLMSSRVITIEQMREGVDETISTP